MTDPLKDMQWEIFRYCHRPTDVAQWLHLCQDPGWPRHRAKEVFDSLYAARFTQLQDFFRRFPAELVVEMLFSRYYDEPIAA